MVRPKEKKHSLRKRLFFLLNPEQHPDGKHYWVDYLILALIVLNVVSLILETVEDIAGGMGPWFWWIEAVSIGVFSAEYVLRLWTCVEDPRYADPVRGRLRHARQPLLVLDLLAVLPFYLAFVHADLRVLRSARLVRIVRLGKLTRYSRTLQSFGRVLRNTREQLAMVAVLLAFLLLISATLLYYAEHEVQPEAYSSIPAAMWWSVVTLTTVGYGDVVPITGLGRLFAGFIAVLGIGMFALPAGILGSAFVEEISRRKKQQEKRCPHCGRGL